MEYNIFLHMYILSFFIVIFYQIPSRSMSLHLTAVLKLY